MYEIIDRRAGTAWKFHAEALGHLIEARGPSAYKKHPENTLFLEHRVILISKAIVSATTSFFSQAAWKIVPWEDDPSSKSPFDQLIDIFCDCADYFAEIKGCKEGMMPYQIYNLKSKVLKSLEDLNAWWQGSSLRDEGTCKEVMADPKITITRDTDGPLFLTLLEYSGLWDAYMLCTYNATRIILLQSLEVLGRADGSGSSGETTQTPASSSQASSTPLLGISSDIKLLAYEILRSIEYCSVTSQQFMGTFTCLFVIDIAYICLDEDSRESRWLRARTVPQPDPLTADWRIRCHTIKVLPGCQLRPRSLTGRFRNPADHHVIPDQQPAMNPGWGLA